MNNLEALDNIINMSKKDNWQDMVTGKALLSPAQQTNFLREFQYADPANTLAKMVYMNTPARETSMFTIQGRVSQSGYTSGTHTTNPNLSEADLNFEPQQITTTKIKAKVSLTDDELEENIERQTLQSTVLNEMGYKMGLDQAYWSFFGDTTVSASTDKLLCCGDGWIKNAGVTLKSKGVDKTKGAFDIKDGVTVMFDAMKNAMAHDIRNTQQLALFVPYEVEDAYRNEVIARQTPLGDANLPTWSGFTYKNMPIIYSPALDDTTAQGLDNTATCVLSSTSNLEWNIFKEITCELSRNADHERNDFIFRYKGIPSVVRKDGVVVAKISTDELKDIQVDSKKKPVYVQQVTSTTTNSSGDSP